MLDLGPPGKLEERRGLLDATTIKIRVLGRIARENGYIESFNGKLRDELLEREIFDTLLEAKVLIERWRQEYNTVRPHSSLGYRPPAPEATQPLSAASATLQPQTMAEEKKQELRI